MKDEDKRDIAKMVADELIARGVAAYPAYPRTWWPWYPAPVWTGPTWVSSATTNTLDGPTTWNSGS